MNILYGYDRFVIGRDYSRLGASLSGMTVSLIEKSSDIDSFTHNFPSCSSASVCALARFERGRKSRCSACGPTATRREVGFAVEILLGVNVGRVERRSAQRFVTLSR